MRYVPNALPDRPRPSPKQSMPADVRERITAMGKYVNFAFEKVERLPGNIMYVKFDGFSDLDIGKAAVIPVARSINPITKGNWEGTGVKPDVAIAADKALTKANALALRQLLAKIDNPEEKPRLEKKLAELETASQ